MPCSSRYYRSSSSKRGYSHISLLYSSLLVRFLYVGVSRAQVLLAAQPRPCSCQTQPESSSARDSLKMKRVPRVVTAPPFYPIPFLYIHNVIRGIMLYSIYIYICKCTYVCVLVCRYALIESGIHVQAIVSCIPIFSGINV